MATILALRHVAGYPVNLREHDVARRGQRQPNTSRLNPSDEHFALGFFLESIDRVLARSHRSLSVHRHSIVAEFIRQRLDDIVVMREYDHF